MFSNVVVGVKELEAGRDALVLARALASATGNLTLAHVQVSAPKPAPDSGAAGAMAKRRSELERLAALRDESQLDAELVYAAARDVRQGLHDTARARHADLLVIGASRYDVIYRDLVGDDTQALLEDAPCAVAVAPVGYADGRGPLRRIGVAYDGSPESVCALATARKLAADQHAELSAFKAVFVPGQVGDTIDDQVAQALETIDTLGGVDAHAEYGEPASELRRYGLTVDLLVLGARKHSPIGRLLGQGTTQRLADEPRCPLLVVEQD
ncbi:MAG: universal stress protein [Solirubrobacterales bacterium]|nr:universal stress protein [Solirubrobacterales bacterium]MBV9715682.1 universal stress protein [Solirubrobacterales bacterium]